MVLNGFRELNTNLDKIGAVAFSKVNADGTYQFVSPSKGIYLFNVRANTSNENTSARIQILINGVIEYECVSAIGGNAAIDMPIGLGAGTIVDIKLTGITNIERYNSYTITRISNIHNGIIT